MVGDRYKNVPSIGLCSKTGAMDIDRRMDTFVVYSSSIMSIIIWRNLRNNVEEERSLKNAV